MATDIQVVCFLFFNDTATTEIYTLSLHDALPILEEHRQANRNTAGSGHAERQRERWHADVQHLDHSERDDGQSDRRLRSDEVGRDAPPDELNGDAAQREERGAAGGAREPEPQ